MRLAVLGGSYNPIHIGHLQLADAVCCSYGYDTIAFIPAFLSPFKHGHAGCTVEDRIAMVKLAIAGNPAFYCELCEVQRQGISYTIDTLKLLMQMYPQREGKIGLIIGDDLLDGLDTWYDAAHLSDYADIMVGNRYIERQKRQAEKQFLNNSVPTGTRRALAANAEHVPNLIPDTLVENSVVSPICTEKTAGGIPYRRLFNAILPVSSSGIRTAIAEKKSWRYLVPPAVYSYIKDHKLYE